MLRFYGVVHRFGGHTILDGGLVGHVHGLVGIEMLECDSEAMVRGHNQIGAGINALRHRLVRIHGNAVLHQTLLESGG